MSNHYRSIAAFALLLLIQGGLAAFTFSPISQEFTEGGKNSSHVFTITNDSPSERIAVKVSIFKRLVNEEGRESLEPCPGDFLIYPVQSILNPGDSRSVRIKWQGGTVGKREKAYRIIAEQLPVDFREDELHSDGAGIRFTFRYEGSLYVLSPGAEPDIQLLSIAGIPAETAVIMVPNDAAIKAYEEALKNVSEEDSESEENPAGKRPPEMIEKIIEVEPPRLKLLFENSGTRHAILGELTIQLESLYKDFEPVILKPEDLAGVSGENLLAGNRRSFLIPEPSEVKGRDIRWSFTYKPVY